MRTNKILTGIVSVVLLSGLLFVSCQKNINSKSQQSTQQSDQAFKTNFAAVQSLVNGEDAQQLSFATDPSALHTASLGSCPPITTYDNPEGIYPRTVTIDWGTGCTNSDGITRSGKTITFFSGDMADSGNYYKMTYDNFYINGVHIEGEVKMSHNSRNKDPQNVYRMTQINRKITQTNGDYIIYSGSRRLVKRDNDPEYPGFPMGYFRVTGSISVDEVKGGNAYQWTDSVDKANPLIYNYCQFIVKGVLFVNFTNQSPWTVDYGKNVCDDQAELTVDGVTTTITLPLDF